MKITMDQLNTAAIRAQITRMSATPIRRGVAHVAKLFAIPGYRCADYGDRQQRQSLQQQTRTALAVGRR